MHNFKYLRPETVTEACEFLEQYNTKAKIIAGGTDLLVQLRDDGPECQDIDYVVDISNLNDLRYIKETEEEILIGPLTTHEEISTSKIIRENVPFLAEAASTVGSPQIRNRGTIGGNIVNASPAADTVPVLVALNSILTLTRSKNDAREITIADIFEKPYKTNILPQELLTQIRFKKPSSYACTVFIKLGRRNALAISRMNIAVLIEIQNDIITDIRISPGSVTPKPQRIKEAEKVLIGKKPDDELIKNAAVKVAEEMVKQSGIRSSTQYKKPVIQNLTIRAIKQALGVKQ